MKTYRTINEESFESDSAIELVSLMHDASYAQAANDIEFMKEMAERVKTMMGQEVRSDTPENFVTDLVKVGYLKEANHESKV